MKKLLLAVAVVLFAQTVSAQAREKPLVFSDCGSFISTTTISSRGYLISYSSQSWHTDSPKTYKFIDRAGRVILMTDQDGDVFLRGKWIGWDHRLSKKYRDGR